MEICRLTNFRNGLATNSSSTHSIIYKNKDEMFKDLNIFELDFYGRFDRTIAATKEAKIKYVLAAIYYNIDLVNNLLPRYPQMKKYFDLIKKNIETWNCDFGMAERGSITTDNFQLDLEFLTGVIENPEIIIVGGSDEEDFVWEMMNTHDVINTNFKYDIPCKDKKKCVQKNGNYWVVFTKQNICTDKKITGRFRFSSNKELLPLYPELIDLKLTNKCSHACPFCFMDSKNNVVEKDNLPFISNLVKSLPLITEFSIGGGNILLYPKLEEVFSILKEGNHIINVTINEKDCETILNDENFKRIFSEYVDGIGISVIGTNNIESIVSFKEYYNNKYITLHVIPELIGVKKICEIKNNLLTRGYCIPFLFLGYKENGRGKLCQHKKLTKDELKEMFDDLGYVSIDTTFANTYYDYLKDNFYIEKSITINEGEFSMYADAVEGVFYKSSYHLDKPYALKCYSGNLKDKVIKKYSIREIFASIRSDNNLKPAPDEEYELKNFYNNINLY